MPTALSRYLPARFGRWAAGLFVGCYLTAMAGGVASHAVGFGQHCHPLMYYFVWDMFCGWSAQSTRTHVLAEGVSGRWYDASEGPWEPFHPYGNLPRINYDIQATHSARIGLNVLRHTAHEPIARVVVVEECWPKKYNLPADLYESRFLTEKRPRSYFAVRHILTGDGRLVGSRQGWAAAETGRTLLANPKLLRQRRAPVQLVSHVFPPGE